MNTLSMRDHGDDDERSFVASLLCETYVAPVAEEPGDMSMYLLNDDDAPDPINDMTLALMGAVVSADRDDRASVLSSYADAMLLELEDSEFMYVNTTAPIAELLETWEEGGCDLKSPEIGETPIEIGETVAVTPQTMAVTTSYTLLIEHGPNTPEATVLHPKSWDDAVRLFWDSVDTLMQEDPLHIYGELITDNLTESVTTDLVAGFVQWLDEDMDGAIPDDSELVPRGVYLYTRNDDLTTDNFLYGWRNALKGDLTFTPAGPTLGPLFNPHR